MNNAAGIVLLAGGITAANELIFIPATGSGAAKFNWRIIPATVVLAAGIGGLDAVVPTLATGLAVVMLTTVLFARFSNAPAPLENLFKAMGVL